MSGSWVLNLQRSRFGDNPHPAGVTLTVEHNELSLRYTGQVNQPAEGQINDFSFDGAIDGKQYPVKEDRTQRSIMFKRVNDRVVESLSKWSDGELRSVITMSRDGRTMERRMTFKDRAGKTVEWTEIYEKKK